MGSGKILLFIRYFHSRVPFLAILYLEMVTRRSIFLHGFEAFRFKGLHPNERSSEKLAHWPGLWILSVQEKKLCQPTCGPGKWTKQVLHPLPMLEFHRYYSIEVKETQGKKTEPRILQTSKNEYNLWVFLN